MGSFRDLASPRALRIFLPVGLFVSAWSGWLVWQERDAIQRAIEVPATIESSTVEDWTSGTGTNRERHYRPVVRFTFELEGKSHVADRVTPLGTSGSKSWARELSGRFQPGDKVTAWVDPDVPGHAFLLKMTSWKPVLGIVFGGLIAIAAGIGMLWRRRKADVSPAP